MLPISLLGVTLEKNKDKNVTYILGCNTQNLNQKTKQNKTYIKIKHLRYIKKNKSKYLYNVPATTVISSFICICTLAKSFTPHKTPLKYVPFSPFYGLGSAEMVTKLPKALWL